jgi:hypothetical protein
MKKVKCLYCGQHLTDKNVRIVRLPKGYVEIYCPKCGRLKAYVGIVSWSL